MQMYLFGYKGSFQKLFAKNIGNFPYVGCSVRGEFKIEKVFVLDSHGFIRQKEDFVG